MRSDSASIPRVGVIGTGYWGKNLVRNFYDLGVLAAICDSDAEALERQQAAYPGVRLHADISEILNCPDVDALAIATPAATHGALARKSIEAGKHVFVEKPLCLDVKEGRELGALARDRKRTLMVGHLLLYHPAFQSLRKVVDSGRIGHLRYIYSNRASLGVIRVEENALWSFAPHDVSMILALAKCLPESVTARGAHYITDGVADITLSHFSFPNDLQAHIFVSWLHPYKDHRVVVIGSDAMIVFNDVADGPDKLLLYPHTAENKAGIPVVSKAEAVPIPYEDKEPLRIECAHFLECVANNQQPTSDAAEGARVLTVLEACERSIISGASARLA